MPWYHHPVFESAAWETFKMQVVHEHELQGAPEGWVTRNPEVTEILRDIRHSAEKTETSIAQIERSVALVDEKCAFNRSEIQALRRVQEQTLREIRELKRTQERTVNRLQQVLVGVVTVLGGHDEPRAPCQATTAQPTTAVPVTQQPLTPCVPNPSLRPLQDDSQPYSELSQQPLPEGEPASCRTTAEEQTAGPTKVRLHVVCTSFHVIML